MSTDERYFVKDLQRAFDAVDYRGWRFDFLDGPIGTSPWQRDLAVTMPTTEPGTRTPVKVGFRRPIPEPILESLYRGNLPVQVLLTWLYSVIRELEDHERLEWLRYQSVRVFDPHPNSGSAFGPTAFEWKPVEMRGPAPTHVWYDETLGFGGLNPLWGSTG